MSPSYFCKVFKRLTGNSLTDFILRMRIDKAKELLLEEELTITQIAFEVGFESHSYFNRVFRRYVHFSPKDFLQQAKA